VLVNNAGVSLPKSLADTRGVGAQIGIGVSGGRSGGFRRPFERRACRGRSCG
jgi:hypothetical protein